MRHIVILISMIYLLTSCTTQGYETIEIVGKESQNGGIVVRGMGVKISDTSILTSAHVVRDDRFVYEISGITYQVSERDIVGDRAILEKSYESAILPLLGGARGGTQQISLLASDTIPLLASSFGITRRLKVANSKPKKGGTKNEGGIQIQKGDPIYTEVSRSGSIMRIEGKILDPSGSVLAYDTIGRVEILSGIVLTDLLLVPGDSGAPIYSTQGDLIDVVHVR